MSARPGRDITYPTKHIPILEPPKSLDLCFLNYINFTIDCDPLKLIVTKFGRVAHYIYFQIWKTAEPLS